MILLDTCTLLWLASGGELPELVRELIGDSDVPAHVSAVSAWEIGVKHAKGRLGLPMAPERWWSTVITHHGLGEVPLEPEIAFRAAALPSIHADPADRILVATALHLDALLLTPDPLIHAYPEVKLAWESRSKRR